MFSPKFLAFSLPFLLLLCTVPTCSCYYFSISSPFSWSWPQWFSQNSTVARKVPFLSNHNMNATLVDKTDIPSSDVVPLETVQALPYQKLMPRQQKKSYGYVLDPNEENFKDQLYDTIQRIESRKSKTIVEPAEVYREVITETSGDNLAVTTVEPTINYSDDQHVEESIQQDTIVSVDGQLVSSETYTTTNSLFMDQTTTYTTQSSLAEVNEDHNVDVAKEMEQTFVTPKPEESQFVTQFIPQENIQPIELSTVPTAEVLSSTRDEPEIQAYSTTARTDSVVGLLIDTYYGRTMESTSAPMVDKVNEMTTVDPTTDDQPMYILFDNANKSVESNESSWERVEVNTMFSVSSVVGTTVQPYLELTSTPKKVDSNAESGTSQASDLPTSNNNEQFMMELLALNKQFNNQPTSTEPVVESITVQAKDSSFGRTTSATSLEEKVSTLSSVDDPVYKLFSTTPKPELVTALSSAQETTSAPVKKKHKSNKMLIQETPFNVFYENGNLEQFLDMSRTPLQDKSGFLDEFQNFYSNSAIFDDMMKRSAESFNYIDQNDINTLIDISKPESYFSI